MGCLKNVNFGKIQKVVKYNVNTTTWIKYINCLPEQKNVLGS